MGKNKTPLICGLRDNSATFYTFGSAIEDIGLNINERNNKVVLSHYVSLNLPKISIDGSLNSIDLTKIADSGVNLNVLDINSYLPDNVQNYVLNFETLLRNQGNYDYSLSSTVTERVFWKWLQKTGAISFQNADASGNFYTEDITNPSDCVIKGFGQITTSSQSSNSYNINNETYIMIPSSYGQMKYIMKPQVDNNYILGFDYTKTSTENHVLEGHSNMDITTVPFRYAYYDDQEAGTYKATDNKECLVFDFSLSDLKKHFNDDTLTYDKLAINSEYFLSSEYDFNTILVYYTIYDSVGNSIATNLFGMMVLNSPEEIVPNNANNIIIPSYKKKRSTTNSFGSSYSFRLNIQTASIYDDTTDTIYDYSTAESATISDFNGAISNLNTAVSILKNNAVVLANMQTSNQSIKELSSKTMDKVNIIEQSVNDILIGNVRDISAKNINTEYIKPALFFGEITKDSSYNYGKLDGSVMSYENIVSQKITSGNITTGDLYIQSIHTLDSEPFDIYVGTNRVLRADVNGNVYINGYETYNDKSTTKTTAFSSYTLDTNNAINLIKNIKTYTDESNNIKAVRIYHNPSQDTSLAPYIFSKNDASVDVVDTNSLLSTIIPVIQNMITKYPLDEVITIESSDSSIALNAYTHTIISNALSEDFTINFELPVLLGNTNETEISFLVGDSGVPLLTFTPNINVWESDDMVLAENSARTIKIKQIKFNDDTTKVFANCGKN